MCSGQVPVAEGSSGHAKFRRPGGGAGTKIRGKNKMLHSSSCNKIVKTPRAERIVVSDFHENFNRF